MRWALALLLLSGCALFEWSWYEEITLEPVRLDSELPEAWVGWETTLHVVEDFPDDLSEWDDESWDDPVDESTGLEVAVSLRAQVQPSDGPAELRVMSWGFDPTVPPNSGTAKMPRSTRRVESCTIHAGAYFMPMDCALKFSSSL